MDIKERKVPEIRFPGFTDDWEQRKLSDVVTEIKRTDENSSSPVMMITAENGFINQSERYSTNNAGQSLKKYILLKKGELAYNHGASKLRPYGSCFALTTEERARIPFVYHCFSTDTENPEFLSIVLNGKAVEKQLRRIVSSGARMDGLLNISFDEYTSIPILLPQREEQNRIADCFRQIDNLITLHQRKLDAMKEYKKGMLQKMFPREGSDVPEIRFPGFTDAWEQRKLGELVQFSKGSGYSKSDLRDSGIPIILYGRLYTKYETVISDVDTFAEAKTVSVYSRGGEVIVPASGETAEDISIASVVEKSGVLLGGDLNVITPSNNLDSTFLAISISNGKPHNDMAKMAQGKSVVHLHNSDLEKIDLNYPSHEEQLRISEFFKSIDTLITLHQRKLEAMKECKKGLLQKMFV